jgi:hypothetical protein
MILDQAREYFYKHNFDILIRQFEISKAQSGLQGAKLLTNPVLAVNYSGIGTPAVLVYNSCALVISIKPTYNKNSLIDMACSLLYAIMTIGSKSLICVHPGVSNV